MDKDKDNERQEAKSLVIGTFVVAGIAILGAIAIFIVLAVSG